MMRRRPPNGKKRMFFLIRRSSLHEEVSGGADPDESCGGLVRVGRPVGVAVGTYLHNSLHLRRTQVQYFSKVLER